MAEHGLGRTVEAQQTLAQATSMIPMELRTLGTPSHTGPLFVDAEFIDPMLLSAELLRREAEALIHAR